MTKRGKQQRLILLSSERQMAEVVKERNKWKEVLETCIESKFSHTNVILPTKAKIAVLNSKIAQMDKAIINYARNIA